MLPALDFRAGELTMAPGTENCFFTAGGVEDCLANGRTGWTGLLLREPIERGKVRDLDIPELVGRFATVSFLPVANNKNNHFQKVTQSIESLYNKLK